MKHSDSTSNSDEGRSNGVGNDDLEATQAANEATTKADAPLDATSGFDSGASDSVSDVTAAFDSTGKGTSGSGSNAARARIMSTSSLIGSEIGGYKIVAHLGEGGMGRVFRADDSSGRPVAIKLLSADLARSSEALARFKQEGLIASQINHSRCVFVHQVDEDSGTPFIAMELMTGLTLKDLVIQQGRLPYAEALKLILQCIEGLIEAHSRGMIHRDIKPANCYLDSDGNVKIGDFGLARSLVGDSELTQTGAFIGTPLFASPEQLIGQAIDVRSDIYSLTATLYYLLAGKAPFESPHAAQVIARIASSDPPPFSSVDVQVPEELERIVMKGLSRDASKRYQNFVEMQSDLLCLLAPKPETAALGRRVIAGLADMFILSLLIGVLTLFVLPSVKDSKLISTLIGVGVIFAYYFSSESLFATSIGKAALRIRVADRNTGRPAGFRRSLLRTVCYVLIGPLFELASVALIFLAGWYATTIGHGVVNLTTILLTWLALFSTWRYSRKRQLLHDWLSGTECLTTAPPIVHSTQLDLPEYSPPLATSPIALTEPVGRFRIKEQIIPPGNDNSVLWYSAQDPQLDRSIWIAVTPTNELDLETPQDSKDPTTRLRFIEQGQLQNGKRWFAYVAPEGLPLQECLSNGLHFAWPTTSFVLRHLLIHFNLVAESRGQLKIANLSEWWIDRSGRANIVSLATSQPAQNSAEFLETQERDRINLLNYRQLLQVTCALALPKSHKLRRHSCKMMAAPKKCTIDRQDLPPLRSLNFCESVVSGKHIPALKTLEQEVKWLNTSSHYVTSKARFLNAVLSIAFSIPILLLSFALLMMPSLIFVVDSRKDLQVLNTLHTIVDSSEQDDRWWTGSTDEERSFWTSDAGKTRLNKLVENAQVRLSGSFNGLGILEQAIAGSVSSNEVWTNPPNFDLQFAKTVDASNQSKATRGMVKTQDSAKPRDVDMRVQGGGLSLSHSDVSKWDSQKLQRAFRLDKTEARTTVDSAQDAFPTVKVSAYLLIGLAIWSWITYGGLSTRVTGICFLSRNGSRMGFLRSGLRSLVIFAPIAVLFAIVAFWPVETVSDVWWTTQLKRIIVISPVAYLASTLFWSDRTIADILSGTTAVPR
jgi:serine/threonine protein kinase